MVQLAVLSPILLAFLVPFIHRKTPNIHTGWFVIILPLVLFIYFLSFLPVIWQGNHPYLEFPWIPSLGIDFNLYIDGLSLLFTLLITGIGTLVVLYSIYYLDKSERLGNFYVYLLMFMCAMLGVVLSDNVFVLYTFWELTSLSSFLLIGYWSHREDSRYGALKSMFITVSGGLAMLGGFILLYIVTDTASIREMVAQSDVILSSPFMPAILLLLLAGAFTKSAQFPFHIWLPDAMAAPTPVSAYLHSATMVKAGIYLVARFSIIFSGTDMFFLIVSGFGLLTLCWASYMAVKQTDLKAILAYSTVSQLGMIMTMLGIGTGEAVLAAIFHLFNHATFKGSLFMVAGIIDHETGTRDIRRLGGLMTLMPISATLAFLGTFSMAGVPAPIFNGFLSKEMFFTSTLEAIEEAPNVVEAIAPMIPYVAVFGSIFTFIYSMILFFKPFTGAQATDLPKKPHEAPLGMLIPPMVLATFIVVIGLLPNLINESLLAPAVAAITGDLPQIKLAFWHGFNTELKMSLTVVALGVILFLTRHRRQGVYRFIPGKLSANKAYNRLVEGMFNGSRSITEGYMTGSLRHYMLYILAFFVLLVTTTLVVTSSLNISTDDMAPYSWPEMTVGVMMIIAAIATTILSNRIAAIISLGAVGFGLSLLFVFFRAPDLALTQLVIETITTVLFLVCFKHLPKLEKPKLSAGKQTMNIMISAAVGLLMIVVGLSAYSSNWFKPISDYFIEQAVPLAGGHNLVNVILVDFRGLDTLFEIVVLGLAALGIYGMIKLRLKEGANK